jgi:3-hydroxy-9,10-secoandrosta-1,3,5(10)-triene-9,17-dione monooxygenase
MGVDALVDRAMALAPILKERAPLSQELRRIPDDTIRDFQEADFFRMLQPASYGGLEVHPNAFFDVQMAVASACPSSAWVLGVVAVHNWQLALFDPRAQSEVWGDDASTLISSSYAPTGKVERVDGGFHISGRWSFSSGCDHCQWVFLGGFAPTDGGPPDMRTFLLPRSDYVIEDTWHVSGLQGTGSNDVVVEGAFVPEHRTHKMSDGFKRRSPGNAVNDSALYLIPFGQIFVRSVSTSAIGMAEGALAAFNKIAANKIAASDKAKVSEEPIAQTVAARAASIVSTEKTILRRTFDDMMTLAASGQEMAIPARVQWRYESALAAARCADAVDMLFTASGGRAVFLGHPLQRYFQDVHAARAHFANNPDKPGRNWGRVQFGQRTQDFFI